VRNIDAVQVSTSGVGRGAHLVKQLLGVGLRHPAVAGASFVPTDTNAVLVRSAPSGFRPKPILSTLRLAEFGIHKRRGSECRRGRRRCWSGRVLAPGENGE
jgi:hypothetical protein